jgi:hypothetical protein
MEIKNIELMHASAHLTGLPLEVFCYMWQNAGDADEMAEWIQKLQQTPPQTFTPESLLSFLTKK